MYPSVIDAHIHFDLYPQKQQQMILQDLDAYHIEALISVSENLVSAQNNLMLSGTYRMIKPAFGFHPEQVIPSESEIISLEQFMMKHHKQMVAVGEVGLPYYLRREHLNIPVEPYTQLLERFIQQAVTYNKPIILHAIYEDAPIVCELLEKYSVKKAHFHWFKGDQKMTWRLMANGYYISITPDVLYEGEIQQIVKNYPLSLMMVETDGPWPFKGPFKNELTHSKMIHQSIVKIAQIKRLHVKEVYETLYQNTKHFYGI